MHSLSRTAVHYLLVAAIFFGSYLSVGYYQQALGQQTPPNLADEVKQLSSRRFIDREQAMLNLIDHGTAVIPEIVKQLEQQNFEGITRSLHILSELTLSDKQGFRANGVPRQSLETLANSNHLRIARQAASALDRINIVREADAIRGLTKLGAR